MMLTTAEVAASAPLRRVAAAGRRACSTRSCGRAGTRRGLCAKHYMQWWTRQRAYGRPTSAFVDSAPVREHVEALRAAELGLRRIATLAGVHRSVVARLCRGRGGNVQRPETTTIRRTIAAAIQAVPIPATPVADLAPGVLVDATGTVRRVRALIAAGYTQQWTGEQLGMTVSNFSALLQRPQVRVSTARAVKALYDDHSHRPGPSQRARRRAQRQGWAPPLAWDEDTIDDPTAPPCDTTADAPMVDEVVLDRILGLRVAGVVRKGTRPVPVPRRDRTLYIAQLRERGWSSTNICYALGLNSDTLAKFDTDCT